MGTISTTCEGSTRPAMKTYSMSKEETCTLGGILPTRPAGSSPSYSSSSSHVHVISHMSITNMLALWRWKGMLLKEFVESSKE